MSLSLIATGLGSAALLALGFGLAGPIGGGVAGVCDVAGIASALMFFGLLDGA